MSIQCRDSNPQPSEHESYPLTTRPGPSYPDQQMYFVTNLYVVTSSFHEPASKEQNIEAEMIDKKMSQFAIFVFLLQWNFCQKISRARYLFVTEASENKFTNPCLLKTLAFADWLTVVTWLLWLSLIVWPLSRGYFGFRWLADHCHLVTLAFADWLIVVTWLLWLSLIGWPLSHEYFGFNWLIDRCYVVTLAFADWLIIVNTWLLLDLFNKALQICNLQIHK